ncbi:zinc knuckle [Cooperia oncophora]
MTESGDMITQDNEVLVAEQMSRGSDADELMAVDQNDLELAELKVCDHVSKECEGNRDSASGRGGQTLAEVAARATQHTMGLVLDLKEKCVAKRDEREGYRGVATTLECYSPEQFARKVEDLVNGSLVISEVREVMGWKKHEIVGNCITLKDEIAQLQAKLEAQQREIEELRVQARRAELVRHRVTGNVDDTVPGKVTVGKQKFAELAQDDRSTLFSGRDERLRAKASPSGMGTKPCGRMPLSRGQSRFTHSESDLSEEENRTDLINSVRGRSRVETRNDNMSAYLKYIALPEVRVFTGSDMDYSWESFQEAFMLKYPRELLTKLSGKAKAQYEALPRELRRGTFEEVMRAMSAAYRGEAQTKRIVALGKLRRLKKQESQSVAEFCVELERLSAIAYPELDELALATTRAQQLYEQLVHWPESYHLLVAMEETGVDAYANLKDTAMRIERRKLTLRNAKDLGESSGLKCDEWPATPEGGFDKAQRSFKLAQVPKQHPSRDAEGGRQDKREAKMRCYRCQGIGHLARNCKAGNTHVGSKATGVVSEERVPRRAERKDVVPTEAGTTHPRCPAPASFGKKHMTKIEIGIKAWRALLDTGSEISIMPITVFNHAKGNGQYVRSGPLIGLKTFFDASGNRMKFETVVEVAVKENGLKETIISMHVSKQKGQTLIIGTNALPLLGYDLVCQGESSETKAPVASSSGGDGNDSGEALSETETEFAISSADQESKAVVSKRAYVAPGEVKWISIKGATRPGDILFCSRFAGMRSGICCVNESGESHIQVCNYAQEPLVLRGRPGGRPL